MMNITPHMLHLLHHTLGLRPDRRESFRNHFLAGPGHHDQSDLEALEAAGLMCKRNAPAFCGEGDIVFSCTDAGKDYAVENLPPEPPRTRYDDYLRSEYSDSFADYLGINKPKFETRGSWNNYEYRMYRSTRYDYYDVVGEWKPTRKAAKESYKTVLASLRKVRSQA